MTSSGLPPGPVSRPMALSPIFLYKKNQTKRHAHCIPLSNSRFSSFPPSSGSNTSTIQISGAALAGPLLQEGSAPENAPPPLLISGVPWANRSGPPAGWSQTAWTTASFATVWKVGEVKDCEVMCLENCHEMF